MTQFSIAAPELARLAHNALAFMPARSAIGVCRVVIGSAAGDSIIEITATDLFTAGEDFASIAELPRGTFESIDLSREDLQALDKIARGAKKGEIQIELRHRDGMTVSSTEEEGPASFLDASSKRKPEDLWERVDEMLTLLERVSPVIPGTLMVDPAFFSRFGKVKCSGESVADLYISSPDDPILVKIGATFRGALMPVDRGEAAQSEAVGPAALWDWS